MNETLQESEQIYRQLVETSVDWAWAIDTEGNHTYSNNAIEQLLGYQVDEIVGTSSFPLMHSEDQDAIQKLVQKSIKKKEDWQNIAVRWHHKDGSVRHFCSQLLKRGLAIRVSLGRNGILPKSYV